MNDLCSKFTCKNQISEITQMELIENAIYVYGTVCATPLDELCLKFHM